MSHSVHGTFGLVESGCIGHIEMVVRAEPRKRSTSLALRASAAPKLELGSSAGEYARAASVGALSAHPRRHAGFELQASNPSIERTFQRPLRALWPAAHVER